MHVWRAPQVLFTVTKKQLSASCAQLSDSLPLQKLPTLAAVVQPAGGALQMHAPVPAPPEQTWFEPQVFVLEM